jgi:hypothetical protein
MSDTIKNVFISHHHKDDASVDGLTNLLAGKGYVARNSSIRAKPENQERLDNKASGKNSENKKPLKDETIRRLLRMKMRWASQLIVVIGKETHSRPWVNWEIEAAHKLGKPILAVFQHGLKDQVKTPENLENYATSRVAGWNSQSIINALEGKNIFEDKNGNPSQRISGSHSNC